MWQDRILLVSGSWNLKTGRLNLGDSVVLSTEYVDVYFGKKKCVCSTADR